MKESYPVSIGEVRASRCGAAFPSRCVVDCQFETNRRVGAFDAAYVTMGKMPVETVDLGVLDQDVVNELEEFSKPGKWRVVLERIE